MLLYRIISILLYPFLEIYLFYRVFRKKEDKHRLKERFGKSTVNHPKGRIIWVHAVSVGETNSALTLIEEMLNSSDCKVLLTTTTITSGSIIEKKLPNFKGRLLHQYLPIDSYFCVRSFFAFWQFSAAIFVESEIWPNLLYEARRLEIPSFLVNARISKKSFYNWNLAKKLGFNIFDYFTLIFVQMKDDVEKFEKLTKQKILFCGNLKAQGQILPVNQQELQKLESQINNRKIFLASSTHKGEEEFVITAHKKLKKEFANLLTIMVIRHPNRAEEVRGLLNGFNFAQRSKNEAITDSTEIYLVDTLGELGIFYSLTSFTFLGGSLLEIGGHNPFEPIKLGCAVISGRGVANFREIYQKLEQNKACIMLDSGDQLSIAAKHLLSEKKVSEEIIHNAIPIINTSNDIAKKIVAELFSFL